MKTVLVIMTGIGFTLGVVFGLLLQLPIDTLPAESPTNRAHGAVSAASSPGDGAAVGRSRRSLLHGGGDGVLWSSLQEQQQKQQETLHHVRDWQDGAQAAGRAPRLNLNNEKPGDSNNVRAWTQHARDDTKSPMASSQNKNIIGSNDGRPKVELRKNTNVTARRKFRDNKSPGMRVNPHDKSASSSSASSLSSTDKNGVGKSSSPSREDLAYLATLVNGVTWSTQLESSCPTPFSPGEVDAWKRHASSMDVVKVEEGCGRMQNRLVTFRDSSRACARYRLNTDQIQGEVFSYYLARLLNVSNIPPTALVRVDSLSPRWRSVHLQLSLAQWADSRLVVLTKYIDGMAPSLIPPEFRGEDAGKYQGPSDINVKEWSDESKRTSVNLPPNFDPRLTPTVPGLGSKSRAELCQLLQWSDLIVFDYLTANLDRVINNMFNRQWNEQMMASPAHNLEQRPDGSLVFLDNESGLFHGYRLLDKYAAFHRSLLGALCVFRPSTAAAVRRLSQSGSVGRELREIFAKGEPELHSHLAPLPERNVKVLQQRLQDVVAQMDACQAVFGEKDAGFYSDRSDNKVKRR